MSVRYKLVSRQDFSKGAEKGSTKFYAQALSNGNATTNEICESVSEESALSSGDVKSFLDRIVRKLVTHLREGRNVQLGELGSFRLVIASTGSDSEKGFNAATMMKRPRIVFTPGKMLQDMRDSVTYTRVKLNSTEEDTASGETDTDEDEMPDEL
ncbi:MAG: HU family DNA-binding protein [Parabacteroides sp.]|nr:HU family DNA-binding protein [Parabacteroides sp.]MBQ8531039.1 HU family DNA-binding protein [Parabacteroides sp.]